MELNYPGHSCFQLVSGEWRVVSDAFISPFDWATDGSFEGPAPAPVLRSSGLNGPVSDVQLVLSNDAVSKWALLSIEGAFTMGYEHVPAASNVLRCHRMVGTHYDIFPSIASDWEVTLSTVRDAGDELHLSCIGAVLETVN